MSRPDRGARPVTGARLLSAFLVLSALTVALGLLGTCFGQVEVRLGPGWEFWQWDLWRDQIWRARASRLTAAGLVGAAMAVAGLGIQGLLRNPLAEPYVLGIASGAGVGVRLWLLLGALHVLPSAVGLSAGLPPPAFAGALATCAVVYGIAQRRGQLDSYSLILSGVIINTFNYSLMLVFSMFADPFHVDDFSRWAMGEIPDAVPLPLLALCGALVAGGWIRLFLRGAAFNVLSLGADVAHSSGVHVGWLRVETFAVAGLMTAAAVALAGPIGFIGLIVPHLCRMALGPDHRQLAVYGGFAGACLLMTADTLCRTLGPLLGVGRIPVGVVMALSGAPFFIFLMRRRFMAGTET